MKRAPCSRTTAPISATGLVLPVAASACTSETKSISGRSVRAWRTCSAVTAVWNGTARSTTSAPQSRSQFPKVCPYGPVITFSAVVPGRAAPRMHPSRGSRASPCMITTSCSVPSSRATRASMAAKCWALSGARSRKGCVPVLLTSLLTSLTSSSGCDDEPTDRPVPRERSAPYRPSPVTPKLLP
ncbi:hypothetical protein SALBM135S_07170 [Streptomyces alboniger]